MNKRSLLSAILVVSLLSSCKDKIATTTEVYNNNFETNNLSNITDGVIQTYNGTNVLGRYNNGGFSLKLNELPKHDMITVSFDLYIHDSWDGNRNKPDGPDIWEMFGDDEKYISTTFSNTTCQPGYFCDPQSYPNTYPNNYNNPKTGAAMIDLPPACKATAPNGTSMYRITKTFSHTDASFILKCMDKLRQYNEPDQKCDESWSVDNIIVKSIKL